MLKSYMRRKSALVAVFMVIAILFASMIPMMSWAEETPGQKPLNFVGAYLTEVSNNTSTTGADIKTTSVSVKPTIKVVFDKNIVNDAVWENNKKCVSLQDSSGINVATNVFRVSDAVNFNERQNIFMTPMKDLNPGAHYKIIIRPDLVAKNGYSNLGMTTNNQPIVIGFTVGGSAKVAVTGVKLNKVTTTLEVGKTETLIANVLPSNATNAGVTWSTSNQSVATVNQNGVVTGVSAGTAMINVKAVDGAKTAICTVTVKAAPVVVTPPSSLPVYGSKIPVYYMDAKKYYYTSPLLYDYYKNFSTNGLWK
jgi:uncharacterized protein YjdB